MLNLQNAKQERCTKGGGHVGMSLHDQRWEKVLRLYEGYKREFGREPSKGTVYCGCHLGSWCNTQRCAIRKGTLSDARVQRLKDAGFVFPQDDFAWKRFLELYVEYKKEVGREPDSTAVYQGKYLGSWCSRQRSAFHVGELCDNRRELLAEAGFCFDLREFQKRITWQKNFDKYMKWKEQHEKCLNSEPPAMSGSLGGWCHLQRVAFQDGLLSDWQIEQLQGAGFAFDFQFERWEHWFELFKAYKREHGVVPACKDVYQGVKIGMWCSTQRNLYHAGTLSKGRVRQLLSEGFVFDLQEDAWQRKLGLYLDYFREFGEAPGCNVYYQGVSLGRWCSAQREALREGKLSNERREKLEAVGFVF